MFIRHEEKKEKVKESKHNAAARPLIAMHVFFTYRQPLERKPQVNLQEAKKLT
jgi:hypothetical protein